MSPLTETDWHRRQIRAFVKAEPREIELKRPRYEVTEAGGKRRIFPDLIMTAQTFRFYPFKRRLVWEWGLSRDGEEVKNADWVLVGEHDADIEVDDFFTVGAYEYEVLWISDHRLYRTAAGVKTRDKIGSV